MFDDAITPMDWLWEPEIDAEIDNQVQALVKGDTDPGSVGTSDPGRRRGAAFVGPQLLPMTEARRDQPAPRDQALRPEAATSPVPRRD